MIDPEEQSPSPDNFSPSKAKKLKMKREKLREAMAVRKKKKKKHESYNPKAGKMPSMAMSGGGSRSSALAQLLTPYELAQMFPDYYDRGTPLEVANRAISRAEGWDGPWFGSMGKGKAGGYGGTREGSGRRNSPVSPKISKEDALSAALMRESGLGISTMESSGIVNSQGKTISTADTSMTPAQRAFLDTIAIGGDTEGSSYWESPGYDTAVGGEKFDSYSDHPRNVNPKYNSSAAGRYQFIGSTWDDTVKSYNKSHPDDPITDFSPRNQDRAALWLAEKDYHRRTGRNLLEDIENPPDNFGELIAEGLGGSGANTTWEILQKKSGAEIAEAFDKNLERNKGYAEEDNKRMAEEYKDVPVLTQEQIDMLPDDVKRQYETGNERQRKAIEIIASKENGMEALKDIDSKNDAEYIIGTGGNSKEIIAKAMAGEIPLSSAILDTALQQEGLHEQTDRDTIRNYLEKGGAGVDPAQTPWCAAFVNSTLEQMGVQGTDSNIANSFQEWGNEVSPDDIIGGDVIVEDRGRGPGETGGHVGFATGETRIADDGSLEIEMYGGNQSDSTSRKWVKADDVMIRRSDEVEDNLYAMQKKQAEEASKAADAAKGATPEAEKNQKEQGSKPDAPDTMEKADAWVRPIPDSEKEGQTKPEDNVPEQQAVVPTQPTLPDAEKQQGSKPDKLVPPQQDKLVPTPIPDAEKQGITKPDTVTPEPKADDPLQKAFPDSEKKYRKPPPERENIEEISPTPKYRSASLSPDETISPDAENGPFTEMASLVFPKIDDYGTVQKIPNAPAATPELKDKAVIDVPNAPTMTPERIKEIQRLPKGIGSPSPMQEGSVLPNAPVATPELKEKAVIDVPNAPVATPELKDKAVIPIPNDTTNTMEQETPDSMHKLYSNDEGTIDRGSATETTTVEPLPNINIPEALTPPLVEPSAPPPVLDNQPPESTSGPTEVAINQPQGSVRSGVSIPGGASLAAITQAQHEWSPSAQRAFSRATNFSDSNSAKHFDYGATTTET